MAKTSTKTTTADAQDRSIAQTLDRGLIVLEAVLSGTRQLDDLVSETGLSRTVVHRLLSTLARRGYVQQAERGEWSPGYHLVSLASQTLGQVDPTGVLQDQLDQLAHELSDAVHLGVLDGTEILYLAKANGTRQVQMLSRVGVRTAAQNTALGKAILSQVNPDEADHIFDPEKIRTEKSIKTLEEFKAAVAEAKKQGYASDNEEATLGITCISVPVPQTEPNLPRTALSVSVPTAYMDEEHKQHIISRLTDAAPDISRLFAASEYPLLLQAGSVI